MVISEFGGWKGGVFEDLVVFLCFFFENKWMIGYSLVDELTGDYNECKNGWIESIEWMRIKFYYSWKVKNETELNE